MATQKRAARSTSKKAVKSGSTARKRIGEKAESAPSRRKASSKEKPGLIKRVINKGIAELEKVIS